MYYSKNPVSVACVSDAPSKKPTHSRRISRATRSILTQNLAVNIAPITNVKNSYNLLGIINFVNYPVIADTDASPFTISQLDAP